MPRFRPLRPVADESLTEAGPLSLFHVREHIGTAMLARHFYVGGDCTLEWTSVAGEEIPWELFRGRLLDPAQTRERRAFESWNVYRQQPGGRSPEPLLSVKLDAAAGQIHVTRAIHCYAQEGYHAGENVYLSREVRKWVRELVGSIELAQLPDMENLRDELICRIFQAVVGVSRLPLSSVEAPLLEFSLGQVAYFYRDGGTPSEPMRSYEELLEVGLHAELCWLEKAKLLETLLHAVPESDMRNAADHFVARWTALGHQRIEIAALLRTLFNEAALSPYTDLVDKALAFLRTLEDHGHLRREEVVDFLSSLLRQLGRHLTAYDLVTFHHRGANYPDALLLDAALKEYLGLAERCPHLFLPAAGDEDLVQRKRIRRRALRQGWLLRRRYEGHRVPDAPTSPGENARILPPPHVRVPDEQILDPSKRHRRLFANDPLSNYLSANVREVLRQSIRDFENRDEFRELGMALFLDRPLGVFKAPGEPDQTLLVSYEAFSRSIAAHRLRFLADELGLITDAAEYESYRRSLDEEPTVRGISLDRIQADPRPGVVSLADARKAAADFVFFRTTSKSVEDFLSQYDLEPLVRRFALAFLAPQQRVLLLRDSSRQPEGSAALAVYDAQLRKRLECRFAAAAGYSSRGGVEYLAGGLRVLRVWEDGGEPDVLHEHDLQGEVFLIRPRD